MGRLNEGLREIGNGERNEDGWVWAGELRQEEEGDKGRSEKQREKEGMGK